MEAVHPQDGYGHLRAEFGTALARVVVGRKLASHSSGPGTHIQNLIET